MENAQPDQQNAGGWRPAVATSGGSLIGTPANGEAERQQLAEWNATQQHFPQDVCVPQLIGNQAAVTPDAVALVMGAHELTTMSSTSERTS